MDVDLIVFDLAGTTVLDFGAANQAMKQALAAAGVRASRDQIDAVMSMPEAKAIEALIAQFRGHAAASARAVEAVHCDYVQRMVWYYESHPEVAECDGASELFAWCHRHDIRTALNTGFSRDVANAIVGRLRWRDRDLIDAVVASDEVPRGRPFPDMIHHLMGELGLSEPLRVAKVGDTPEDIQEGRAAGCGYVVGITSGAHSAESLSQHEPSDLIAELLELPDILATAQAGAA